MPSPQPVKPVTRHKPLHTPVQKKLRYTLGQDEESQEDSEVGMYAMITTHIMQARHKMQMTQCIMPTFG